LTQLYVRIQILHHCIILIKHTRKTQNMRVWDFNSDVVKKKRV
jgi:hypothetical protein